MLKRILLKLKSYAKALEVIYKYQYTYQASALAFTTLLSLVPLVSVCAYIFAKFDMFAGLDEHATEYILANFLPSTSKEIIVYLNTFSHQVTRLPIFSIGFLFVTATMLVATIHTTMANIWHEDEHQISILSLVLYILTVFLIPILIGIGAFLNLVLSILLQHFPNLNYGHQVAPLIINAIILFAFYTVTSGFRATLKSAIISSIITSCLLEAAKFCFVIYISNFATYALIYGALSTIPVFLIWLYIFWLIIIYGAATIKIKHHC